jgi:hypothetical protein
MTPASIISKIKTTLEGDSTLSGYIKEVFLGVRENITLFPCIIIEYIGDNIGTETYPYEQRVLNVNITAYVKVTNKDKQIVGDTDTKGVANVENDIRKALSSDNTLGLADVYDSRIMSSVHDFEQYPIRGFAINFEVHYRQNRLTRA